MGAFIKGPYGLGESRNVSGTITVPAIGAAAINIDNSLNTAEAIKITSSMDNTVAQSPLNIITTNAAFDRSIIRVTNAGTQAGIQIDQTGNSTIGAGRFNTSGGANTTDAISISTGGTGADIKIAGRATAAYADSGEGAIVYDTTLHKLRVRGAAGWETITSA